MYRQIMSKVSFIHNVAYYKHKFVPFWKTKTGKYWASSKMRKKSGSQKAEGCD